VAANPDDMHDPFASLDRLTTCVTNSLPAFDPLPTPLSPREVELACIELLTGAIRTATALTCLYQQAAEEPTSHAFADAIAQLEARAAHTAARLDELAGQRQPDAIPWLQRLRLQARYEAMLERLLLTQAQLRRQAEVRQARRAQAAQKRERRPAPQPPAGVPQTQHLALAPVPPGAPQGKQGAADAQEPTTSTHPSAPASRTNGAGQTPKAHKAGKRSKRDKQAERKATARRRAAR
jgi:hypothetical protein